MHKVRVKVFNFTDLFLPILYSSCFLGLIHEWLDILNLQVWIIWFLLHLAILSLFIVYQDMEWLKITSEDKKHLLYISLLTVLWYYQKIYAVLYYPAGNYEPSCKRDFLIIHFSLALTLVVVVAGAATAGLLRF
jgi:hypothetical protein